MRLLIGENAIGKSSFITDIARALERERGFQRSDFLDFDRAIDVQVTLTDLNAEQLGTLAEVADFGASTSLTVGMVVTWNGDAEETNVIHGYPPKAWRPSNSGERDAIDLY